MNIAATVQCVVNIKTPQYRASAPTSNSNSSSNNNTILKCCVARLEISKNKQSNETCKNAENAQDITVCVASALTERCNLNI